MLATAAYNATRSLWWFENRRFSSNRI